MQMAKDVGGLGVHRFASAVTSLSDRLVMRDIDLTADMGQLREKINAQQLQIDQHLEDNATLVNWCKSLVRDIEILKDMARRSRYPLPTHQGSQLFPCSSRYECKLPDYFLE